MIDPRHSRTRSVAAIFDFDGTLVRGDSFRTFLGFYLRTHAFPMRSVLQIASAALLRKMRAISLADAKARCLRSFVGWNQDQVHELAEEFVQRKLARMITQDGIGRIHWHTTAGHVTILATSAPNIYLEHVKTVLGVQHIVAPRLEFGNGGFSGKFAGSSELAEGVKINELRKLCRTQGIDLEGSYAYTDHHSDLALLRAVSHPHVVSPTAALRRAALRAGWPILYWR